MDKKFEKSRRNIFLTPTGRNIIRSLSKIALVLAVLGAASVYSSISPTNSFFSDSATVSRNTFSAGFWIPTLSASVDPEEPDGKNDWYVTLPCVTLETDLEESEIYYEFSDDGDPFDGGEKYPGECVEIPEGKTYFQAIAVHSQNDSWRSEVFSRYFKVDMTAPEQPEMKTIYKGHDSGSWIEVGCGGYTNDTEITIDWHGNDEADIDYYWFGTQFNTRHKKVPASPTEYYGNMTPGHNPYYYTVIAVDKAGNESEKSEKCYLTLDQDAPDVAITAPVETTLSGTVPIRGSVEDENPHHYWLVIQNSSGVKVYGPGTVNDDESFTDKNFFDWDTTLVANGDYVIKLEARDAADNKDEGSVHWLPVTVGNTVPEEEPDDGIKEGDIVINEVMWMGSSAGADDEWIELRNMTDRDIDLKHWTIENARKSNQPPYQFPSSAVIRANGYFLLANFPSTSANSELNVDPDVTNASLSLTNNSSNGHLVLKNADGNIIDQAKGDTWPAGCYNKSGCSGLRQSMERNSVPGNGLDADSWHTCTSDGCNDGTFWKTADGVNYGTPGAANLSANDPSTRPVETSDEVEDEEEDTDEDGNDGGDAGSADTPTDNDAHMETMSDLGIVEVVEIVEIEEVYEIVEVKEVVEVYEVVEVESEEEKEKKVVIVKNDEVEVKEETKEDEPEAEPEKD